MAEIYANAPTDTHAHGIFTMMQRKYKLKGMWFLDCWPATRQRQLIIADPASFAPEFDFECFTTDFL